MNSFGRIFRISILGESHGPAVGVVIDGCPAGIPISPDDFEFDLGRRKSGAKGTTPRTEEDLPNLVSGLFNGYTTGAPITVLFENRNVRSSDYSRMRDVPRPGHADFVASRKFGGYQDFRGGGHFSGRLTLALVAAGVVAKKILGKMTIRAILVEAGGMKDIEKAVERAIEMDDSIGGIVECRVNHVPVGLGEPFFDSLESQLSHIVFAIPAIKGIEFGSGFAATTMKGSEHNDNILETTGKTETNHAGGINGGISNGNELLFRVAVKPTSSTSQVQQTMNMKSGRVEELEIKGRHDKCIALRVPPVLEAATAIVMADFMLMEQNINRINKA
jgi:chorismate synthase